METAKIQFQPKYIRLPKDGERDPVCGLSRTEIKLAVKAGEVRSVAIRKPGKDRGVRLIDVDSLLAWIERQAA
jgi:hypothetical protein